MVQNRDLLSLEIMCKRSLECLENLDKENNIYEFAIFEGIEELIVYINKDRGTENGCLKIANFIVNLEQKHGCVPEIMTKAFFVSKEVKECLEQEGDKSKVEEEFLISDLSMSFNLTLVILTSELATLIINNYHKTDDNDLKYIENRNKLKKLYRYFVQ
ncbi:MAG: hypothetical protein HG467_001600 [Clostridiales bacterium]|nr:hypothetical protein [Clostridiales bacterium]